MSADDTTRNGTDMPDSDETVISGISDETVVSRLSGAGASAHADAHAEDADDDPDATVLSDETVASQAAHRSEHDGANHGTRHADAKSAKGRARPARMPVAKPAPERKDPRHKEAGPKDRHHVAAHAGNGAGGSGPAEGRPASPAAQSPDVPAATPHAGDAADDDTNVVEVRPVAPPRIPPKLPKRPAARPGEAGAAKPTSSVPARQSAAPVDAAPARTTSASTGAARSPMSGGDVQRFRQRFDALVANISRVVVGKEGPIRLVVTAMLAGGHVLLEDNPGTGKTQLARALAHSIDAPFKRIQFTPDLLPADVDGTTIYNQRTGELSFRKGPVFASIVLADEINRASPKTQSAMLEVMEEQKVTVDGVTYAVPQPFIVIATQNPIEQLGTYRLPEAQMDRFLIKTSVGYPSREASVDILRQADVTDRAATVSPVMDGDEVLDLRRLAESVHMDDAILEYIARLVEATRDSESTTVGSSMRGALALTRCARIWAAADGRAYAVPDDVRQLAVAVLAHRLTLTPDATFAGRTSEQVIEQALRDVPVPEGV